MDPQGAMTYIRAPLGLDEDSADMDAPFASVWSTSVQEVAEKVAVGVKPECMSRDCRIVCTCREVERKSTAVSITGGQAQQTGKDEL